MGVGLFWFSGEILVEQMQVSTNKITQILT